MDFICLSCGAINSNAEMKCVECYIELDSPNYERLIQYCKDAVRYGYDYRVYYEEQVEKTGEINSKPSIVAPANTEEWLAVAVLGGLIGNGAFYILLETIKKIKNKLKSDKSENNCGINIILSSDEEIQRFALYISDYYNGKILENNKVKNAINEEILADTLADKLVNQFINKLMQEQSPSIDQFRQAFKESRKEIAEPNIKKPSLDELSNLFPLLRQESSRENDDENSLDTESTHAD